jgi:hypothetical protein
MPQDRLRGEKIMVGSSQVEKIKICLFINTKKGILAGYFRNFGLKFLPFPFIRGGQEVKCKIFLKTKTID